MGIYSTPPPPELAQVDAFEVDCNGAAKATKWITRRINEALTVGDKIPIMRPP